MSDMVDCPRCGAPEHPDQSCVGTSIRYCLWCGTAQPDGHQCLRHRASALLTEFTITRREDK